MKSASRVGGTRNALDSCESSSSDSDDDKRDPQGKLKLRLTLLFRTSEEAGLEGLVQMQRFRGDHYS